MYKLLLTLIVYVKCSEIEENAQKWNSIINEVNSAGTTWTAGYNFHPSISTKALRKLCGATFDKAYDGPFVQHNDNKEINIPKEFDARKAWPKCKTVISHIRDQGNCGSCWAVAAAEVLTDRYCIATKGRLKSQLSAEDLLTCCNDCGHGCEGGSPWYAFQHFKRYGIVTGGDYHSKRGCKPYTFRPCEHHVNGSRPQCPSLRVLPTPPCHHRCSNSAHDHSFWRDHRRTSDFYVFVSNETQALQLDILKKGPVEASFIVYEDFLTYKSGVYQHITGSSLGGHAVKVIGWGEENGTPYWLVVNSWNSDWGDKGYFKIKRGSNECRFENFVLSGTPAKFHFND